MSKTYLKSGHFNGGGSLPCVASSDAARAPHRRDARKRAAALAPAQCRHGDARGLEVSPGGLLKNELVQCQIRDRLAQSAVLELKVLQALHLLRGCRRVSRILSKEYFDLAQQVRARPVNNPIITSRVYSCTRSAFRTSGRSTLNCSTALRKSAISSRS